MTYLVHKMAYFIKSCFHFCIADKAAACAALTAAFNAQPNNWTLLDCNIECCIGDNCNNQSVTVIPPTTPVIPPTTPSHTTPSSKTPTSEATLFSRSVFFRHLYGLKEQRKWERYCLCNTL